MNQTHHIYLLEALRLLAGSRSELAGNWSDRKLREVVRDTDQRLEQIEALIQAVKRGEEVTP